VDLILKEISRLAVFTVNLTANVAFQTGSAIGVYPLPVDQVYACNNLIGNRCPLDADEGKLGKKNHKKFMN
jgi:hypothetical protein